MASKVTITAATVADYEACVDINRNVYSGFDYLPGLYMYYMHDPNSKIFVAKIGQKVVSETIIDYYCILSCSHSRFISVLIVIPVMRSYT